MVSTCGQLDEGEFQWLLQQVRHCRLITGFGIASQNPAGATPPRPFSSKPNRTEALTNLSFFSFLMLTAFEMLHCEMLIGLRVVQTVTNSRGSQCSTRMRAKISNSEALVRYICCAPALKLFPVVGMEASLILNLTSVCHVLEPLGILSFVPSSTAFVASSA